MRMESFSPQHTSADRPGHLRQAAEKLEIGASRLIGWLSDKGRQFRSLPANETLAKALLSAEKAPAEGTRLAIGEIINIYHADGSRTRLRICGVRSGGFSNAYTVINLDEMRAYCLKENRALPGDEEVRNRNLAVEAEISLYLGQHPHLVATRSVFYYRSRLYLLTEYLPGESLDVELERRKFSVAEAVGYGIQICRAMEFARSKLPEFIHGDIKPGNCMLTPEGCLKLGDFGMSSAVGVAENVPPGLVDSTDTIDRSSSRGWGGTTPYMAPEMFNRRNPDRSNGDIYALGIMLFEMIAGIRPFRHPSKSGLILMHRTAEAPLGMLDRAAVPDPLIELIRSCIDKVPANRPQAFDHVESILLQIAADDLNSFVPPAESGDGRDDDALNRAECFAVLGKFEAALTAIENAISTNGRTAELLARKSTILVTAGDVEAAYAASTAALMADSNRFLVLLAHARVLIARKSFENAQEYLERAYLLEPRNCVVLNLLGTLCQRHDEHRQGARYLRRSLEIDREQPEALNSLASLQMKLGRNINAAELARRALTIDVENPESTVILADAKLALGEVVEAVKGYKNALRRNPDSKVVRHKYIRTCLTMLGSKRPGFARFLLLGAALLQTRNPQPGLVARFVERVVNQVDSCREVIFFFDLTLSKLADCVDRETLERLSSGLKSAHETAIAEGSLPYHLLYSFGCVFYHLDEKAHCEMIFSDMLAQFGPNESSYYYLAACSEIRGDYTKALELYKKANHLLDCEDSRTGIHRVSYRLKKTAERRAA